MATLNEINALIKNPHLISRISGALMEAAETIRTEGTGVTDHASRFTWASEVLATRNGARSESIRVIGLILQNTLIANGYRDSETGGSVTDVNVQTKVDAVINFLAGVEP